MYYGPTLRRSPLPSNPLTYVFQDEDDVYVLDQGNNLGDPWLRIETQDNKHLMIDKAFDVVVDRREAYILAQKMLDFARYGKFWKNYPEEGAVRAFELVYLKSQRGKPSTATKRKARTPNARTRAMAKKPAPKKATPKSGKKICK